ncbi:hypothetical protein [Ancylobacter oerskovii]|uniref:Uncharacterized protein n=1 Tax=Ancylobacter oerskovii TaxID=459519 RepID=A0ABW4Z634_9HYPH
MDDRERRWMQLMQAALAGDRPSYERLLREIAPAIRSVVERRLRQMGAPTAESETWCRKPCWRSI